MPKQLFFLPGFYLPGAINASIDDNKNVENQRSGQKETLPLASASELLLLFPSLRLPPCCTSREHSTWDTHSVCCALKLIEFLLSSRRYLIHLIVNLPTVALSQACCNLCFSAARLFHKVSTAHSAAHWPVAEEAVLPARMLSARCYQCFN